MTKHAEENMEAKRKAIHALQTTLANFMPVSQRVVLMNQVQGREKGMAIAELVNNIAKVIAEMPHTYQQDGLGDEAVAHLHYFRGGVDAWITEKDMGSPGDANNRQIQAFGKITLTEDKEDAELGYINIQELIECGVELDLYWTPVKLKDL